MTSRDLSHHLFDGSALVSGKSFPKHVLARVQLTGFGIWSSLF